MAHQESAHEETTHGLGYTPSYSPPGITPWPSTAHAPLATPNESITTPKLEETTNNLEGTSRLKSEISKHFKNIKANGEDKAQCNYFFKLLGRKSNKSRPYNQLT